MKTLLISAGPTREYIDDVRFLSNGSTGRMGIEIASVAHERGLDVHLLLGPTDVPVPEGVRCTRFVSALELERLATDHWHDCRAFVATAAVSDYRPRARVDGKIKKGAGDRTLELTRNPDVLAGRGAEKDDRVLIGFALEASMDEDEARRKLVQKHLDVIILNTAANLGSRRGDFEWIEADGPSSPLNVSKRELAEKIVDYVQAR